jgi:tRNA1(Val) A37 N6-methylase TrmN6
MSGADPASAIATTDDVFLGGGLRVLQPAKGYRAGIDAVLLAAAVRIEPGAAPQVLDAGAGVGVVGLCLARRLETVRLTLIEIEPRLAALARENARRNGLDARCRVMVGDVTDLATLPPDSFDIAVSNPPFGVEGQGRSPADPLKARAHEMPVGALDSWVRAMARALRPGGRMVIVHRADALAELLTAMSTRFGGLEVMPVQAYAHAPALRVLITGQKGSKAPLALVPSLVLHAAGGGYRPEIDGVLRNPSPLPIGNARAE